MLQSNVHCRTCCYQTCTVRHAATKCALSDMLQPNAHCQTSCNQMCTVRHAATKRTLSDMLQPNAHCQTYCISAHIQNGVVLGPSRACGSSAHLDSYALQTSMLRSEQRVQCCMVDPLARGAWQLITSAQAALCLHQGLALIVLLHLYIGVDLIAW